MFQLFERVGASIGLSDVGKQVSVVIGLLLSNFELRVGWSWCVYL